MTTEQRQVRELAAAVEALGLVVGEILDHPTDLASASASRLRILARIAQERAAQVGESTAANTGAGPGPRG